MTVLQLEKIIKLHSPELVFLSEAKNKKDVMNKVKRKLRHDKAFMIDHVGKSGSMTVLWRNDLQVKKVFFIDFTIGSINYRSW